MATETITSETSNSNATNPALGVKLLARDKIAAEVSGHVALQRLMPELQAIFDKDLLNINTDVPTTVATVLGVNPRIQEHKNAVLTLMPTFDATRFDQLEDYAMALDDAHGTYLTAIKPSDELAAALVEATQLRTLLYADASALIARGVLDSNALGQLQGGVGYKNLATDLHLLAKALGGVLLQAAGKTSTTAEELERATRLHQHIYRLVGLRAQSEPAANAAGNLRQRAYTALFRCYDQVRRGITALRWAEGDADEIAPSLHAGQGGSRKKQAAVPATNPNKASPIASATEVHGTSSGGSTGVAPVDGSHGLSAPTAAGKPSSDPFLS